MLSLWVSYGPDSVTWPYLSLSLRLGPVILGKEHYNLTPTDGVGHLTKSGGGFPAEMVAFPEAA